MATSTAPPKILVVDDDVRLRDLLSRYLTEQGFQVATLPDARDLDKKLQRDPPHLIVLDLMLPGEDGLAICRRLRGSGESVPIIMLTAKGEDIDRIVGLEMGADDYLPKPFNPRELVARIHAVLRRQSEHLAPGSPSPEGRIPFGPFVLDPAARTLLDGERTIHLTTGEFSLVKVFSQHPRQPLAREKLMLLARGRDHDLFDRAIDVQVSRLRKLIEPDPANPRYIQTVWGFGYVFVPADEAPGGTTPAGGGYGGVVKLWPRSLFGRLTLLLIAVVAIAMAATILFFRHDRAALIAHQFGENKIVQLQALRAALAVADTHERRETLRDIGSQYGVRIVPEAERPMVGGPALGPAMQELRDRLRESLGPETELRVSPRLHLLFVRVEAGGAGYWIGVPLPPRPEPDDIPTRALIWSLALAISLSLAAFLFTRYLARPLRELDAAVERVGRGETPPPLPEHGPSEIATLNRGFNRMIANLRQLEQDRALLLAGVSHDLRTPLARLRLGLEMGIHDAQMKEGMTEDIQEMDRIIGQFLDFARGDDTATLERTDPNAIVAASVDRYARSRQGRAVQCRHRPCHPAAPYRVLADVDQPRRQRSRVRRATRRCDDVGRGGPVRARCRRPRARHSAGGGGATEAAVHARVGRAHVGLGRCRRGAGARHRRSRRAAARRHVRSSAARRWRDAGAA